MNLMKREGGIVEKKDRELIACQVGERRGPLLRSNPHEKFGVVQRKGDNFREKDADRHRPGERDKTANSDEPKKRKMISSWAQERKGGKGRGGRGGGNGGRTLLLN